MRPRLYQPRDAPALDVLLQGNRFGDVRLGKDLLVVAGLAQEPEAVLVGRSAVFVHELALKPGPLARPLARAVVHYGLAQAQAAGCKIGVFYIDPENTGMRRFVEELGAMKHAGELYTVDIE